MITYPQQHLERIFRSKYADLMRELGGGRAIVENVAVFPRALKPVMRWNEVLYNHKANRYAEIVFDAPAPPTMNHRLFIFSKRKVV